MTEVLTAPHYKEEVIIDDVVIPAEWKVLVKYNSYGSISSHTLRFKTEKEAKEVTAGFHFTEMF